MFIFVLLAVGLPVASNGDESHSIGLEAMARFEHLPILDEDASLLQVSSHDRNGENSKDGFDGTYSSLYRNEEGDYILFDEIGAGCIARIWMTFSTSTLNPTNHVRFYFDEDVEPRIDISLADFFKGNVAPFLSPLVGDAAVSSGGYYCYLPFPFARRCRIAMSHKPLFYHITYQRIATTEEIASWTGAEDSAPVRAMWEQAGADPKPTNGTMQVEGMMSIPAGSTGTLFSAVDPGVVSGILLDIEPHSPDVLSNTWIRMVWDDAALPQVWAPLGEFFGCGFGETNVTALPLGMQTDGPYYCWFPMPYWASARIELVNHSTVDITNAIYEIRHQEQTYDPARTGWFHADARSAHITQSDGRDYLLLDTNGWGKVVGAVLSIANESRDPLGYLEGDERIYIDGSATPQIYGTGTEDFFNGGWYFNRGPFSLPVHGHPMRKHEWRSDWGTPPYITGNFTAAYRFFLSDAIPFRSSIRFGMEHGYNNSQLGRYSSVVHSYRLPPVRTGMVLRAVLDVGDLTSELAVAYSNAASVVATNSWRYEGDDDHLVITDKGRISSVDSSFTVSISSTNRGVLIRRRADAVPGQHLKVHVDDAFVGDWYMPDCNFTNLNKRWVDAEFRVPYEYTAGKSAVRLRMERDLAGSDTWNEYAYWIYGMEPLVPTGDMDGDNLPDAWETAYFNNLLDAKPEADDDADSMSTFAEYVSGTYPQDAASLFQLQCEGDSVSFWTVEGRIYNVWRTADLLPGTWELVQTNVPGNGQTVSFAPGTDSETIFYRADVRLEDGFKWSEPDR